MDLIRDPSAVAALPAYTDAGTAGYAADDGSTVLPAQTVNHILRELEQLVIGLGGTLDPLDDGQIFDLLTARVGGISSAATDTGVVYTPHRAAVIASHASRAGEVDSLVAASDSCLATGVNSAVLASDTAIVSANGAATLAALNVENHTPLSLAGGKDTGAPISPGAANQNQSWRIESNGGHVFAKGRVGVGGTIDDASPASSAYMDGVNGEIVGAGGDWSVDADGAMSVSGDRFRVDADGQVCVKEGANKAAREIAVTAPAEAGTPGARVEFDEENTLVTSNTRVEWELKNVTDLANGSVVVKMHYSCISGHIFFVYINLGAEAATGCRISYRLIQPI